MCTNIAMNNVDCMYNWRILLITANWWMLSRNISQDLDYPDSFEWSQEVRIVEVALYSGTSISGGAWDGRNWNWPHSPVIICIMKCLFTI